jgi:hypothetical protein
LIFKIIFIYLSANIVSRMKKGFLPVIVLLMSCCFIVASCSKNKVDVTSINPSLTATIGTYTFNAATVQPSTLDTQSHDTTTTLYITATSSDIVYPWDKIILTITKYKGETGTFSIVEGQAGAEYLHSGVDNPAIGGVVSVTQITSNSIIGYFSFNTGTLSVSNGSFNVGKP